MFSSCPGFRPFYAFDPVHILLLVRVRKFLKGIFRSFVPVENLREILGNRDCAGVLIRFHCNHHDVAGAYTNGLPYVAVDHHEVIAVAARHEGTPVWEAVNGSLDRYAGPASKGLLYIKRNREICPGTRSIRPFEPGFERMLLTYVSPHT